MTHPTPRTDAFAYSVYSDATAAGFVGGREQSPEEAYGLAVDFARALERELARAVSGLSDVTSERDEWERRHSEQRKAIVEAHDAAERHCTYAVPCVNALRELVRLKDIKERIEAWEKESWPRDGRTLHADTKEYGRGKDAAWEAARAALAIATNAAVAQSVEHLASTQGIAGSSPAGRSIVPETGRDIVLDFETEMLGTKVYRCKRCDCSFTYDPATHECHQSGTKSNLQGAGPRKAIDAMVDSFLAWPLPESVCSDPCATVRGYPNRIGTNLLTAIEARAMLEHVLRAFGEITVSATEDGQCIAVTRTDEDGQILAVLWEGELRHQVNRWNPVGEGMPEDGRDVLIYIIHERGEAPATTEAGYWNGMSWFCASGMLTRPSKITHWMPLPAPPSGIVVPPIGAHPELTQALNQPSRTVAGNKSTGEKA